jgi:ribonuclease HII
MPCLLMRPCAIVALVHASRQSDGHLWGTYAQGYGTVKHMAAIRAHGAVEIHRRTFAPLKHMDFSHLPPP